MSVRIKVEKDPFEGCDVKIECPIKSETVSEASSDDEEKPDVKFGSVEIKDEILDNLKLEVTHIAAAEYSGDEDEIGLKKPKREYIYPKKYPCPDCPMAFTSKPKLKKHVYGHRKVEGTNACPHCDKKFKDVKTMRRHIRLHTGENLHECSICERKFPIKSKMLQHMETVHAKDKIKKRGRTMYTCPECGKRTPDRSFYERHLTVHTDERNVECPQCPRKFKHNQALMSHMLIHTKPYECSTCGKRYPDRINLVIHERRHQDKNVKCPYCIKKFSVKENLQSHAEKFHPGLPIEYTDGPVSCQICNELYESMEVLKFHVKVHPVSRNFECAECGMKYFERGALIKHLKWAHLGIKKPEKVITEEDMLPCSQCDRKFKTKQSRDRHFSSSHSDERPYACRVCQKTFKRHSYLTSHMKVHSATRITYPCEVCGMIFKWKSNMNRHARDEHSKDKEKEKAEKKENAEKKEKTEKKEKPEKKVKGEKKEKVK